MQAQNACCSAKRREKGVSLYRDGLADEEKGHDENSAGLEEAIKTDSRRKGCWLINRRYGPGPMGRGMFAANYMQNGREVEKKLQKR